MVCAVVVTYNRKELCFECINSILAQSVKPDTIVVLDNGSTDGTYQYLKDNVDMSTVDFHRLDKNYTSAGGFYYAMKLAYEKNPDYLWIMDDDTIPETNALEAFLEDAKFLNNNFSFLASYVIGLNNVPMNVPGISLEKTINGYPDWYIYLYNGIVKIENATYVSLLIRRETIENVGLPYEKLVQWGLDTEHTKRMSEYMPAYFCGKSKVLHKREGNSALSPVKETNKNRLNAYYSYYMSNLLVLKTYYSRSQLLKFKVKMLYDFLRSIRYKYRFKKMKNILKGYFMYLFGLYDRKLFKKRYYNQKNGYLKINEIKIDD